ncbi:Imm10 family immunity protein [Pseudomonas sp. NPDC089734]|uniref:Imm10 family immunity protein n=1 Tax=Pseudomonas sp. NPDC089734 TaxID=3364469 RepID=UPI00382866F8
MNIKFSANYYDSSLEDGVLTVGFADNEDEPQDFLILQRAEEADDQDEELDQDTYYIEIGGAGLAGYGGVEEVVISEDKLVFSFLGGGGSWCEAVKVVEVVITSILNGRDEIESAFLAIFVGTPTKVSRL